MHIYTVHWKGKIKAWTEDVETFQQQYFMLTLRLRRNTES